MKVVSLFCGIGASDFGLYAAAKDLDIELRVIAAYDSWEPAVRCYNANLPHPVAEVCDLKQLDALPECDLVIGGPPCQPFSLAGKRAGHDDERNCLPDFMRLVGARPYIMENVVPRLINAPWSERLCAADFGDVTSRKRWFYSNYLLHVMPTPGPRRIRDIRDHAEDARVIAKRSKCKAGNHGHYDTLDTLSAHSWHGHDIRGSGKLIRLEKSERVATDDEILGSLTSSSATSPNRNGYTNEPNYGSLLRLGLRGNSASAFEDDTVLGSVLANSFHANEASKLVGCRNPSLLEMARAHSIPDSFDWSSATKTQRGQMIANCWPIGMATAVCRAMLVALGAGS